MRKAEQKPRDTHDEQPDRAFWLFRYSSGGRIREAGLGQARGHNAVTLAEARERRMRDQLREGKDPLLEKAAAKAQGAVVTFAKVASLYITAHEAGWRNHRQTEAWRNTLRNHVLPTLGPLPVGDVGTAEVMALLAPLWREKVETASRVRGRIESVLDYAAARSWPSGENPAR